MSNSVELDQLKPQPKQTAGRPSDNKLTARILSSAAALLNERGYAMLTIEQVARDAGCGKAAIYRRYPGKPELVAAVFQKYTEMGEEPDTGSVRDDLLAHALQNRQNQEGISFAHGRALHAMLEPEVFPILWESIFQDRHQRGLGIIARGVERGELPQDVDADVLLDSIAGLTLYRYSVKNTYTHDLHYQSVINALVAHPPRIIENDS
ncbi:TetR/AcrR family transcriptional regulator [Corynebacterium alimapuense]|uniref:HTH tetR-type domain-containing protein n=1 Tax=Corynebacterium alimapuense TaxID=1576874 RepID=A0A3M8K5W7_9CORY|nr:TetR/AcrR family transcriptional regulator [Corynebacterium alimapuense]RNE48623.1 hypothetical protein C5L39_09055 [Corynebacterium alimapuense]